MTFMKTTLTAAVLATAGTTVSASDYFGIIPEIENAASSITLDVVRSSQDGFVQIVNENGMVLGMKSVHAGANADVLINLRMPARGDLTAQLVQNGTIVTGKEIEIDRF